MSDAQIKYTEVRYESLDDLNSAFALARQVGVICRLLTWRRIISGVETQIEQEHDDAVDAVMRRLREFLKRLMRCPHIAELCYARREGVYVL